MRGEWARRGEERARRGGGEGEEREHTIILDFLSPASALSTFASKRWMYAWL